MRHRTGWCWAALAALTVLATACGVLPGTDSDGQSVGTAGGEITAGPRPTPSPTPTPTVRPTPTQRPTATPLPTPTPTPGVTDSYTDLLASMRALFSSADLEADIAQLVPLPFAIPIPADADLERVELLYRRWDRWEQIVGEFPPIDTPSDVQVSVAFLTNEDVDTLAESFRAAPLAEGYAVETDDSQEGVFSDVVYQLNGGTLQRGRDGEVRATIFGQGEQTFVELRVTAELISDPVPPLTEWPTLFEVPFSGAFVDVFAVAIKASDGIEVGARAVWVVGVAGSSQAATMDTLLEVYPVNGIAVGEVVDTGPDSASVATITHPTGSTGTMTVDFVGSHTQIAFELGSLPG